MNLKKILLDLLYPRKATCMACGSMLGCGLDDICDDCREKLAKNWVGVRPLEKSMKIDGAAFAYRYAGPAGGIVRSLKYGGVGVLAGEMGKSLARAVMLLQIEEEILVTAVPMHPKRLRRRGRNHAELLARSTAENLKLPYADLLMRTRNARQQARLSREERRENLKGAFAVRPEYIDLVRDNEVLVIDDVLTTGATAAACADALRSAGASRVYFAAYSYGERKKHG